MISGKVKRAHFVSRVQLLYTYTDSLLLVLQMEDVYADKKQYVAPYDFCDHHKDHPCYSMGNKKVVGKFKDECASLLIAEFVGFRPKMYSVLTSDAGIRKRRVFIG